MTAMKIRLVRDCSIGLGFFFLGTVLFGAMWPKLSVLWGVFFLLAGILVLAKISARPYADLDLKSLPSMYFGFDGQDKNTRMQIFSRWRRVSIIFIILPILFFVPAAMIVKTDLALKGLSLIIGAMALLGLLCSIMSSFVWISDKLKIK